LNFRRYQPHNQWYTDNESYHQQLYFALAGQRTILKAEAEGAKHASEDQISHRQSICCSNRRSLLPTGQNEDPSSFWPPRVYVLSLLKYIQNEEYETSRQNYENRGEGTFG
jgi:hypothetical protein